ncbi:NAD(P)H-binding protein [Streptomyces antibioticus]
MIAVTAASGAYGRLVVAGSRPLLPAGSVVAVVRAPERAGDLAAEGVEVRRGDYDDPGSLRTAFKGWTGCCWSPPPNSTPPAGSSSTAPPSTRRATPGSVTWSTRASWAPAPGPRVSPRPTMPPSAR